jgi:hypothetical protein
MLLMLFATLVFAMPAIAAMVRQQAFCTWPTEEVHNTPLLLPAAPHGWGGPSLQPVTLANVCKQLIQPSLHCSVAPQGVADIFAISAATGRGTLPLVRAVRAALDALPVLAQHEQVML